MDVYDDAELERKKQIARYAAFVTTPAPTPDRDGQPAEEAGDTGNPLQPRQGDDVISYGPGAVVAVSRRGREVQ